MDGFVFSKEVEGLPHYRVEHSLISLSNARSEFVKAVAEFFVQEWMSAFLPEMLTIWECWHTALPDQKKKYLRHFTHLCDEGVLLDNPEQGVGETDAMATFSETMLRWIRKREPAIIVEPPSPVPPVLGNIDLIEITGDKHDYRSLRLTMWEVKSSEHQVSAHNSKIHRQLTNYPKRFFSIANSLAERYKHINDPALIAFIRNLNTMIENCDPQIHYGVFITYDSNVPQAGKIVPGLHKYPSNHPSTGDKCHHLDLFLIPDFRELRIDVWKCLHLGSI